MSVPNRLKALVAAGVPARGLSCVLGEAQIAEEFAVGGFDYVYVDQQHGHVSDDRLLAVLRALSRSEVTPLVRVRANDAAMIGFALDAGAHGIIVPMVEDRAAAERAVEACRYGPRGHRSWGPVRAAHGLGTDPATVDGQVMCLVMVETAEGVENVDEIVSVDGIDGVYVGPADLSVSLGEPPRALEDMTAGAPLKAVARIREACARHGRVVAVTGDFDTRSQEGFGMVTVGSDIGFLRAGLAAVKPATSTGPTTEPHDERTAR